MTARLPLSLVAVSLLVAACSNDKPIPSQPWEGHYGFIEGDPAGAITLEALRYNDAKGGVVPIRANWSISDPSVAELQTLPTPRLLPKKSGTLVLKANEGKDPLRLTFTAYTKAEWETGRKRYEEGRDAEAARPCKSCHAKGAAGVHDQYLAEYKNEDLLRVAEEGYSTLRGEPVNGDHKWNLTPEERAGIIAYLRSLDESRKVQLFE